MTTLRARGDEGVSMPLVAISMVAIVTVSAMVVDLGYQRMVRREAQSSADLITLAATQSLAQYGGEDPARACEEALRYALLNIEGFPSATTLPCGSLDGVVCDASTAPLTVDDGGSAAPFHLSMTWPVPDAQLVDPDVVGHAGDQLRRHDGHDPDDQCDRIRIDVGHDSPTFLSGVVGNDNNNVEAHAVARRLPYHDSQSPNLWLLEPHGCDLLKLSGGGELVVGDNIGGGLITVDSDASACGSNQYVISTGGNGEIDAIPNFEFPDPSGLAPPGRISSYAVHDGQVGCISQADEAAGLGEHSACNPADDLDPVPESRPVRATRAPVDWRYNCLPSYPDYQGELGSISLAGCPDAGTGSDYITRLAIWWFLQGGTSPNGWTVVSGSDCTVGNGTHLVVAGNVYVNCTTGQGFKVQGGTAEFTGGNVYFAGGIKITGGLLVINGDAVEDGAGNLVLDASSQPQVTSTAGAFQPPSCAVPVQSTCWGESAADASYAIQAAGGFSMTGGQVVMNHVAYFQNHAGTDQNDFGATGGDVFWTPPAHGPFKSLALWSEETDGNPTYAITGGGATSLAGIFFVPEADPMSLAGSGALLPQAAQFVARRLTITGGGTLKLTPTGLELLVIPPPAAVLIR